MAQVRWAKQSLERLRVGSWRGHTRSTGGVLLSRPALALQREMLHTVAALHQFVCDRVVQSASRELAEVSRRLLTCLNPDCGSYAHKCLSREAPPHVRVV